jgi:uncharacterized protein (TIGR00251 family)
LPIHQDERPKDWKNSSKKEKEDKTMSRAENWVESVSQGVLIRLKIQPRASRTQIVGLHGEPPRLKIRLAAPPVDGKANDALLAFLKVKLGVTLSQLEIIRGQTSPMKDVLCVGKTIDTIQLLLLEGEN